MVLAGVALSTALAIPGAAFADDCANFSRPAPADPTSCVQQGNWLYFGCEGFPHWGFITPGPQSGTNGNYQDFFKSGGTHGGDDLLGWSAVCQNNTVLFKRQDGVFLQVLQTGDFAQLHGIWSGCTAPAK